MGKEILIENFDPKPAIKKNAEAARDWEFSEDAKYLYGIAIVFRDRLIDPIARIDRSQMPDPVISFDDLRNNKTLAAYTVSRNAQGLLDEITFNTARYVQEGGKMTWSFGRWAQLETLLHEQIHLWQQRVGKSPVKPGRSHHNKEFVEKCESLGLHPMPDVGCHVAVADGVFAQLMAELGIKRPADVPREKKKKIDWFKPEKEKGRSTLKKWECGCGQKVRVGREDWPGAICKSCGTEYVNTDGLSHTIYKKNNSKS
ncbi:hypothetical protein JZU68_05055 [bacterium]|jgi:hypothetical protein|nr:hypothetical protein [bacterium]